jgi:hypothetical protein
MKDGTMKVQDLRDLLADLDGTMPVLVAMQPSWPMEHELAHRVEVVEGTAYLAEAGQLGYLSEGVAAELGW